MNLIDSAFISGRLVYMILVPLLREISAIVFAIAISKDCKARNNGSSALWGLFTLLMPVLSAVIYFIYSRLLVSRKAITDKDKRLQKSSRKLIVWAVIIYAFSLALALCALITTAASGLASL